MKKFRFLLLYCIVFSITISAVGQISLSFESEVNTVCNGVDLNYDGPKILINEVMLAPNPYDGSIYGCHPNMNPASDCRGEWIELYNPDVCHWVDISCFFLGNATPDGGAPEPNYPGGFIMPEGTLVPPYGFVIIRGTEAPPVPEHLLIQHGGNTIEIIVDDPARVCFGDGSRLWFPNNGGWMAIYDHNGVPQDAISWGDTQGVETSPCNPGPVENCSYSGTLASYNEIPEGVKNYIANVSPETNKTFRRIPDGEDWEVNVQEDPTYGTCNSTCPPPPEITCNGKLTVIASGGNPPYSYLWDGVCHQTTATAIGLCPGEHCVTVTDSESNVETACYSVENLSLDVTATTTTQDVDEGNDIHLNSDVTSGMVPYSFSWSGPDDFSSDVQNPIITNAQLSNSGIYTIVVTDIYECTGTDQIIIEVSPVNIPIITSNNINIYPNPANSSIFIDTEKTFDEISIIDIHGRTVIKQKNFTGGEIDISEIVAGVYFVRLQSKDEVFVEKLVVE